MGSESAIGWTDATWNPWMGCHRVSPGCAHCYMYSYMKRVGRDPETVVRSKTTFRDPLKWREPRTVFTCSLSDFFHEAADEWRPEAWEIIRQTPQHRYLVLTKRPERIRDHLPEGYVAYSEHPGLHGVAEVYLRRLAHELSDDDWPDWTKDSVEPGVEYVVVLARVERAVLPVAPPRRSEDAA